MSVKIIKDNPMQFVDDFNQLNKQPLVENLNPKSNQADGNDLTKQSSVNIQKSAEVSFEQTVTENQKKEPKSAEELQSESELVADAMKTISEFISMPVRTVNFTQDDGSEKTVIKIYDSKSNELIKQFPSEEILLIAQRIVELQQDISQKTGILLDESI